MQADDAFKTAVEATAASALAEARLWLTEALAEGPRPAGELLAAARRDGISRNTGVVQSYGCALAREPPPQAEGVGGGN